MSDVDGTDLSKVTADTLRAAVAPVVAEKGRFVLGRVAAAVLAVVLPLFGAVAGFVAGRAMTTPPAAVEAAGSGSGSAAPAPAASGSAAAPEVRTVPYDAKSVAAEAAVGPLSGTGEVDHPAHPADAATAAEADAK